MYRFLWLFFVIVVLVALGCESQQTETTKTASQPTVKPEKAVRAEAGQVTNPAIAAAMAAADQAQKHVEQTAKTAELVVEDASKAALAVLESSVAATEETLVKADEQVTTSMAAATNAATATVTAKEVAAPAEITLEASYGNITFPHGMHAEKNECSICHGDIPPSEFDITKEIAHKLCKGCHKDEGAGPTGCNGCHKK